MNQPVRDLMEYDVRVTKLLTVLSRTYEPGWSYDHKNYIRENAALYYIRSGTMTIQSGNRTVCAGRGSVILLDTGFKQNRFNHGPDNINVDMICFFTESRLLPYDHPLIVQDHEDKLYLNYFRQVHNIFETQGIAHKLKIRSLTENIIYHIICDAAESDMQNTVNQKLLSAVEYIHTHKHEKITIKDLCLVTLYSEAHLRRLFTSEFHMSPMDYVTAHRMETAKQLLLNDTITVQEIAETVGYPNCSHFINAFSRYTDMTPGQYRRSFL